MRIGVTLLMWCAVMLATGIDKSRAADSPKPCPLRRVAALELTPDRGGRPQIPVTLAGKSIPMLVDTGGVFSGITETTRKDLDLPRVALPARRLRMFDGASIAYGAIGKGFMIGRLPIPDYGFMVLPDPEMSGESGLLGADVLSVFDLDFDFAAKKLNLFEPNNCGDGAVYWSADYAKVPLTVGEETGNTDSQIVGNASTGSYTVRTSLSRPIEDKHIFAKGQVDGIDVRFAIDTGASTSALTMEQAKLLFHWSSDQPGLIPLNPDQKDKERSFTYPFKSLTLGGITVNNPRIRIVAGTETGVSRSHDMLLGMDVLRHLHIYIAYKDQVMYVTPGAEKPAADAAPAKPN